MREIGIAVVGLGLLTACGETTTSPGDDVAYFPLTVGNVWTYAPSDPIFGEAFVWQVTARRGDTVSVGRPSGPSHPGPVVLLDGGASVDLLLDNAVAAFHYRFTAGDSWVRRDPWECDDDSEWTVVEEPNPVTTPAGTFRHTLRMDRLSAANCTDAGTMTEWWAPGVGLVRWEELNYYAGGPLAYELLSYVVS